jgi:hypothetical protein
VYRENRVFGPSAELKAQAKLERDAPYKKYSAPTVKRPKWAGYPALQLSRIGSDGSRERERVEFSAGSLYQSPQASTPYTKVAKSAKKEIEVASSFAFFATLV